MITIADYGMGNLGSVFNMLKKIGAAAEITCDPEKLKRAAKILLPGVGAFDTAMQRIADSGLSNVLRTKALEEKVPILGICLGMQLLTGSSEEGSLPGLGWIRGVTKRFPQAAGIKVPHMGWNTVKPHRMHPLLYNLPQDMRFYFVHSFYVETELAEDTLATAHYGSDFAAVIAHGNIMGAQFHPERSHRYGAQLLKNFYLLP